MNPLKKLMSWLRGPTDPESLASEAEAQHLIADRDTIRISQNTPATQFGNPNPILVAPTPDVLDPGSEDSPNSRS
jgi:hypothetical protein